MQIAYRRCLSAACRTSIAGNLATFLDVFKDGKCPRCGSRQTRVLWRIAKPVKVRKGP